ncbi:hypothetical protein DFP73DRAFT_184276 [Morchella snyderi]|nr:hypothetical protein DFP73DRAFT_184276 [Morchella snyderi]
MARVIILYFVSSFRWILGLLCFFCCAKFSDDDGFDWTEWELWSYFMRNRIGIREQGRPLFFLFFGCVRWQRTEHQLQAYAEQSVNQSVTKEQLQQKMTKIEKVEHTGSVGICAYLRQRLNPCYVLVVRWRKYTSNNWLTQSMQRTEH